MMDRGNLRRAWSLGAVAVLACAGWIAFARRPAPPRAFPPLGASSVTVARGVHHVGRQGPSPAYAVETSDGLVLIDTGLEEDAASLKAELTKLGLNWARTRAILLTHAHGDHVGGARHMREMTGARVYAGEGDADVIRAGGPREAFFSTFDMPNHEPHPTPVDVELTGGESLAFGDTTLRAIAAPGHTPGSICYLLERDGLRIFFGGDVVMHPGDEKDSLGTYSAYLAPRYRGDAKSYLHDTIKTLRAMPAPDLVLPGHPRPDPPRSPAMSQGEWAAMLDAGALEMERLLTRFEADGADFLDDHPKALLPGLYYLGDRDGAAVYAVTEGARLFLVDAPGGPGLAAFVTERLGALGVTGKTLEAVWLTSLRAEATEGLVELIKAMPAKVVTTPRGLEAARSFATEVVSTEDIEGRGWPDVKAVPLRGPGQATAAYRLVLGGKTVLITGRLPVLFDRASFERFESDVSGSRDDVLDYLGSVNVLEAEVPHLWLPARPSDGQNANLYDGAWDELIKTNYRLAHQRLVRPAGP